jgi:hypothetical protein
MSDNEKLSKPSFWKSAWCKFRDAFYSIAITSVAQSAYNKVKSKL